MIIGVAVYAAFARGGGSRWKELIVRTRNSCRSHLTRSALVLLTVLVLILMRSIEVLVFDDNL